MRRRGRRPVALPAQESTLLFQSAVFFLSLLLLTLGAECFVRGATVVASRLGLSAFFIGLTIVGLGSSAPEFATSTAAALRGNSDLSVGNVIGSNLLNIALVLGLTALICPIPVKSGVIWREVPIMIGVAALPFTALATGGVLGPVWGVSCVVGLGVFIAWGYRRGKEDPLLQPVADLVPEVTARGGQAWWLAAALLVAGLGFLVGGSQLLIGSATSIARELGISDRVIALTIVAGGTSAPELFTSLVSAWRRQADMAIGNIIGSNIFNILGILGFAAVVHPQTLAGQAMQLDLPVMLIASLACLPIFWSQHRIGRGEGALLLAGYTAYLVVLLRG